MSSTVHGILTTLDALADADKHAAVVEILRRFSGSTERDLSAEALTGMADELFQALDREEACHAAG